MANSNPLQTPNPQGNAPAQEPQTPAPVSYPGFNARASREVGQALRADQYRVADIPGHIHNGIDTNRIDPNDLSNAPLYFQVRNITLNPTQIKALNTTPITLVPAYGVGTAAVGINSVIIVEGITARVVYKSAAYTGSNALEFRYNNAAGAKVSTDMPSSFLNSSANAYYHVTGTISVVPVANAPIVVRVPTADPAAGNSPITFSVNYRVVTI